MTSSVVRHKIFEITVKSRGNARKITKGNKKIKTILRNQVIGLQQFLVCGHTSIHYWS